mmetsp:Transcript_62385/g.131875  ORF Transcript_62385/g.131875 Transcript_62385/m.131875 type:complete len:206 (+) Transcript_62385:1033-1650(+)
MHEAVLEEHSHIDSNALFGDRAAHFSGDAEVVAKRLRSALGSLGQLCQVRLTGHIPICFPKNFGQLLALFLGNDKEVFRRMVCFRKSDDIGFAVEVGVKPVVVVCLDTEICLHVHLVAEQLGCPLQSIHAKSWVSVGPRRSPQQPSKVALHNWSDTRSHALDCNGCSILQLTKVDLGNTSRGHGLRVQLSQGTIVSLQLGLDFIR